MWHAIYSGLPLMSEARICVGCLKEIEDITRSVTVTGQPMLHFHAKCFSDTRMEGVSQSMLHRLAAGMPHKPKLTLIQGGKK